MTLLTWDAETLVRVRGALRTLLQTLPALPPVAWANVAFTPPEGALWLRESMGALPAQLRSLPATDGLLRLEGNYYIDVFAPLGQDMGPALRLAGQLGGIFRAGVNATQEGQQVIIRRFGTGTERVTDGWVQLPCTVAWRSDVRNP